VRESAARRSRLTPPSPPDAHSGHTPFERTKEDAEEAPRGIERPGQIGTALARGLSSAAPSMHGAADPGDGRYWARTSDPQLVELVLSQLS
jgi:hypothetical protein